MWNFQRIICIWICCVSCMFGTTQLSSLVQAVPYEYFDDHEQSFYDLDTEQIQAKYDTRLLSQQMLQTEQQQQQQQQQYLENLKGYQNSNSGSDGLANRNKLETRKHSNAGVSLTTKLKSNEGYNTLHVGPDDVTNNNNDDDNDWLKETATKAAAAAEEEEATSAITDTFDELHLPRAASCFTNGQKYTHGQKVPRLDNCEVCLCMDGEIFCWWEKCDKKSTKASTTYEDYSTPFEESSTTRIQLNPKTTYKTTLKPMKKPTTNEDYKYDDDDSAEIFEMQQEYEGLKEQLMRKEHEQEELQEQQQQHKLHNHNKQMVKKKIYQQQEEEKHNKKIKEQNKKKQEEQQRHKQLQQKQQKQHKNNEQQKQQQQQHHHAHNRNKNNNNNNNNNNHDYSSSGSNSKILNFPENLPSVLYYDYKTEEHHQHQHQHREQHLKHQRQKQQQQQHEQELKHRQQQQQQREQQQQQQQGREQQKKQHHINRHHEYGQDFNTYSSSSGINNAALNKKLIADADERKLHNGFGGPSTKFKHFSNGNENIYNGDLQTDSDILPEPPTKKPKYSTSITETTATQAKTTGIPISQLYHFSTSLMSAGGGRDGEGGRGEAAITSTTVEAITKSIATTTNTPSSMPTISLKKQNFSPWDYNNNNVNRDKTNKSNNNKSNNKESTEDDIIDTDDQDDAFHRWLTSTEKNNKNNFTLNDSIIEKDDEDGDVGIGIGAATIAAVDGEGGVGGVGGFDASNSDYNMDDRIYENFNLAKETTKTNTNIKSIVKMGSGTITTTKTLNAFDDTLGEGVQGIAGIYADGNSKIIYENSQKPKYEQNFNDNNSYNTNTNYKNLYQNNNMEQPTSGSNNGNGHIISSTSSNEDNGVASVVNIDIMLTASSADSQQLPQQTNIVETTSQHRQQHQQLEQQQLQTLQDFEHEKQIAKEQIKFIQSPPVLISNTNDVDNNNNKNPLYSIINDNTKSYTTTSSSSSNNNNNITINHIVGDGLNIEIQNMGVNLSSNSNNINYNKNNNTTNQNLSSSNNDSFRLNPISTLVSQTNATSATTTIAGVPAATTPPLSTTLSPERQCNVMGTLYKIGDILPQDTGNCLQCICIDGSTSDDTPRVTCSPHNCPPLVLPDLFDATGY